MNKLKTVEVSFMLITIFRMLNPPRTSLRFTWLQAHASVEMQTVVQAHATLDKAPV